MITYWVDSAGAFGIGCFLAGRGQALRERFSVRHYDFTAPTVQVEAGPQIFSALDQLTDPEREAVGVLGDGIAREQPQARLLNDPRRSLLRAAVLDRLVAEGLNRFRAHPAREHRAVSRFPVFVRGVFEHTGSLTGLLHSSGELRRAMRGLRVRGHRLNHLLIVEFCDTADGDGIFRKYSAMRVGDAIVPRGGSIAGGLPGPGSRPAPGWRHGDHAARTAVGDCSGGPKEAAARARPRPAEQDLRSGAGRAAWGGATQVPNPQIAP